MLPSTRHVVADVSQAGQVRREVAQLAAGLGFSEEGVGRAALVATELGRNLALHANGGELLSRRLVVGSRVGLELLALDTGPGMADVARCLTDGFSTLGTAGEGLGAVHRVSSFADVYSREGSGTAVLAEIWEGPRPTLGVEAGAVCVAVKGELECGDGWAVKVEGGTLALMVCDGLGHGPFAATAAQAGLGAFQRASDADPLQLLELAHAALRSTRGAAVAVAVADLRRGLVRFAGVGNIAGVVVALGARQSMVSHNGTLGGATPSRRQEFPYLWPTGSLLVMHSDGLTAKWDLSRYPGLFERSAGLIAGVLYRDFSRVRDDATVVVLRQCGPTS